MLNKEIVINKKSGLPLLRGSVTIVGLLLVSTYALAAPRVVSINASSVSSSFSYTSVGPSQVEYAWPRVGIVCTNGTPRTPTTVLSCGNRTGERLPGDVSYKIIDFHDFSSTTFLLSTEIDYTCTVSGNGNFFNFSYGRRATGSYFISWSRNTNNSWVQLQREGDGEPAVIFGGTGRNVVSNLEPNRTYRVKDLTYGGRTTIELTAEKPSRFRCF